MWVGYLDKKGPLCYLRGEDGRGQVLEYGGGGPNIVGKNANKTQIESTK